MDWCLIRVCFPKKQYEFLLIFVWAENDFFQKNHFKIHPYWAIGFWCDRFGPLDFWCDRFGPLDFWFDRFGTWDFRFWVEKLTYQLKPYRILWKSMKSLIIPYQILRASFTNQLKSLPNPLDWNPSQPRQIL